MVPFAIAIGDVIEVSIIYVKLDQEIENKIDVKISAAPCTSLDLLTQMGTDWSTAFKTLTANDCKFQQARAQKITDIVQVGVSPKFRPKRVRGELQVVYGSSVGNTFNDGTATTPHLPLDVTVSIGLQTSGSPALNWGRKSHGALPAATIGSNGEIIAAAGWQTGATNFYVGAHAIGATSSLYTCVVTPATQIMRLPLPHPALGTLVNPVIGANVGPFVGSQATRRVNPQSTLGH